MMEPHCTVCGETKVYNLYMFDHGLCLCHSCMETAAQNFVHDNAERKLKESERLRKEFETEQKANRARDSQQAKQTKQELEKANRALKKENDNLLVRIADAHIESNRFRRRYEEAQAAYEEFQDRTRRVWWGVAIAGFAIGTLLTLMFLNPR